VRRLQQLLDTRLAEQRGRATVVIDDSVSISAERACTRRDALGPMIFVIRRGIGADDDIEPARFDKKLAKGYILEVGGSVDEFQVGRSRVFERRRLDTLERLCGVSARHAAQVRMRTHVGPVRHIVRARAHFGQLPLEHVEERLSVVAVETI
jgi:hypothetical protein